ncbi:MAG TPA: hypothetical protein VJ529_00690 [Candidatus Bathyarchaeia archaeon]|nr:hypothetical protein [Candidatus Bathyarchaeia archaeon]
MGSYQARAIKNLKSHKDIYFHLSFELNTDEIAKTCATLFPLVFGKWSVPTQMKIDPEHRLPEIAFQALYEDYFKYTRIGRLSLDFAHKFYTYPLKTMIELVDLKESQKTHQMISELLKDPQLGKLLKRILREILTSLKRQP